MTRPDDFRILIVDDEPGMRDLLRVELKNSGYQVLGAENGVQAIEILQKEKCHLVLSDMKMPEMNGIVLLEKIKNIDPSIEVIMMTGHGTVENAVHAMKKGAYDFILKPFGLDELRVLIEKAMEKKELKGLVALYESTRGIFSTIKLNELCGIIMTTMVKTFKADEGSVMLLNDQNKLYIAASRGIPADVAKETQLMIGERISGLAAKNRQELLLIEGADNHPEFKDLMGNHRISSSIVCPMLSPDGTLLGVVNLNRTRRGENFDVSDLQGVSIFTSLAAMGIVNARLFKELEDKVQELDRTQDQLLQSEKAASIGRLVAGVAHELNNPLTSVIGYSQLANGSSNINEIKKALPIIHEQALRCSKIVKELLLFARQRKVNKERLDAYLLINECLKGLSLEFEKRKIKVSWEKPTESLILMADSEQLKQVFTNLLTNSFQAMESVAGERKVTIKAETGAEKIRFYFNDNGPGIPAAIAGSIFDPFFTTKDVGKGTGLGLSMSYGIIKEHGGSLSIEKRKENGACFIVELPIGNYPEIAVEQKKNPGIMPLPDGVWKILLVEDEPSICQLISSILEASSYQFDVAEDGAAALEKIKEKAYDLVLCDYRLPRLDGIALYTEVKKINPAMARKFLFISGSTEFVGNSDDFFERERLTCLLKPFTRNELLEAVGRMIRLSKHVKGNANESR